MSRLVAGRRWGNLWCRRYLWAGW